MQTTCWYCDEYSACPERSVLVPMYGNLRETKSKSEPAQIFFGPDIPTSVIGTIVGNSIIQDLSDHTPELEYIQTQIPIPRCKRCANIHAYRRGVAILFALIPLTVLINFSVSRYVNGRFSDLSILVMLTLASLVPAFVVGGWTGSFISTKLFSHIREKADYLENPQIEKHINSGWYFGKQPLQEARAD